jgi:hypothetical protein
MEDADWTPRHQPGGVYCSRRCGCRCTRAEYDNAVSEGAALAARLGEGWEADVWENGGWNYRAKNGVAEVTINYEVPYRRVGGVRVVEGYTGWVNSKVCGQTIVHAGLDPLEAIGLALQEARGKALRFSAELDAISNGDR